MNTDNNLNAKIRRNEKLRYLPWYNSQYLPWWNIVKNNQAADHVLTIKTSTDKYKSQNKKLHFCFVDFRKAYDSIWPEVLFKKLLGYGISTNFVSL